MINWWQTNLGLEEKMSINENLFYITRDENWFKWRFLECPYKNEILEFNYDKEIMLCRLFNSHNYKRLNILYSNIHEHNRDNFNRLVYNWCLENNVDFIWSLHVEESNSVEEPIYEKLFLNKSVNYACWAEDNEKFTHLEKGLHNCQGSDSDLDSIIVQDE